MEKSKVYFTTFKTSFTENLRQLNSILANMGIWRFCAQIMPRSWQIWSKKKEAGLF